MINDYILYKRSKLIIKKIETKLPLSLIDEFENIILTNFNDLEKTIMRDYYLNDLSLKEISKKLHFSYSHIQGTHMKIKQKMKIIEMSIQNFNEKEKNLETATQES